jgi:hypothetical protein
MFCNKCGKQIDDSARFCNFCGSVVGEEISEARELGVVQVSYGSVPKVRAKKSMAPLLSVVLIALIMTLGIRYELFAGYFISGDIGAEPRTVYLPMTLVDDMIGVVSDSLEYVVDNWSGPPVSDYDYTDADTRMMMKYSKSFKSLSTSFFFMQILFGSGTVLLILFIAFDAYGHKYRTLVGQVGSLLVVLGFLWVFIGLWAFGLSASEDLQKLSEFLKVPTFEEGKVDIPFTISFYLIFFIGCLNFFFVRKGRTR